MTATARPRTLTAEVTPDPLDNRYWVVVFGGVIHGGRHYTFRDACLHADGLDALPPEDKARWLDHLAEEAARPRIEAWG